MSFQVFGLPVSRGVAIGRAVLVASSRVDVAHYFIDADAGRGRDRAPAQRARRGGRRARRRCSATCRPRRRPSSSALLDVHLMLLHDEALSGGDQALDPRAPLQRRVGAVGAARSAGAPVRRDGGRVPARAQGRPRAGGRAPAARAWRAVPTALAGWSARDRAATCADGEDSAGAGRQRHRRRPTCCSSSAACSPASSPTSAARPRTRRSSRAAWTSRRWSARARRAA